MKDTIPNIWMMQTDRDTRGLVRALAHPEADIRRRAAVALRIIGNEATEAPLRACLQTEADPKVRVAILAALDHIKPEADDNAPAQPQPNKPQSQVERLIEHLMSNRPEASVQAAKRLGELGDKLAVPPLVAVFRNRRQPPRVRLAAAEALLKLDSAPAEVTLLAALRSEKWTLRRNGAAILGQLQAEWAVEPLGRALRDPKLIVAKTALAALKRIGTPDALSQIKTVKLLRNRARTTRNLNPDKGQANTVPSRPKGATGRLRAAQNPPEQDRPKPSTSSSTDATRPNISEPNPTQDDT